MSNKEDKDANRFERKMEKKIRELAELFHRTNPGKGGGFGIVVSFPPKDYEVKIWRKL